MERALALIKSLVEDGHIVSPLWEAEARHVLEENNIPFKIKHGGYCNCKLCQVEREARIERDRVRREQSNKPRR